MLILRVMQLLLILFIVVILSMLMKDYRKNKEQNISRKARICNYIIGFVFQFLDALGIGSFATTMTAFKLTKSVPDALIPGTLNIGASIPCVIQALLFITVIEIDMGTLAAMVGACVVGTLVGVRMNRKLPERAIKTTMAIGLFLAALLMLFSKMGWGPAGGIAIGLSGFKLAVGIVCNFVLGILLPLGIGNYAPCMVIVYMLGMSPAVAFPLMMCSAAFGLSTSTLRFIQSGNYQRQGAWAVLTVGSIGVIIAVKIVKSLPLDVLQWLVIVVVLYTSATLFKQVLSRGGAVGLRNREV